MYAAVLLVLSLVCSIAYALVAALPAGELWKCAVVFVAAIPAISLLHALLIIIIGLFYPKRPIKDAQCPLARFVAVSGSELLCFWTRVRPHLRGGEKLPEDARFLIVSNHRSALDPFSSIVALRRHNIAFISKPSNMALPFLGRIAYGLGFLPIDRENDREALKTILLAADYMKKDICSIFIYPEGTRSHSTELLPFHAGSFKIAQKAKAPLVIAAVSGTQRLRKYFPLRVTDVYVDILETVPAEEVCASTTASLAERAREEISAALHKEDDKA